MNISISQFRFGLRKSRPKKVPRCKKCGKIIKDWTRNKTGICSSNRCRYRYKYNKKYYDTWRRKHRKQQREYALKRYYEKKSHRKV